MFLINVHKSQLRKRKRSRQRKRRGTSVQSCSTRSGDESTASPRLEEEHEEERRNSFAEEEDEEDLLPALALINSQQALLELIERHSEEGVEGLADLENLPGIMEEALKPKDIQSIHPVCFLLSEHLLLEELELLDNITSCNVVDNYLMLDEYEQNLIKEGETPGGGGGGGMRGRLRKWSLVRQPSVGGVQVGKSKHSAPSPFNVYFADGFLQPSS